MPSHETGYEGFWPEGSLVFDKGYVVKRDDPKPFKQTSTDPTASACTKSSSIRRMVEPNDLTSGKFSRDGQQLSAFLPRSQLPSWEGVGIDMLTGPMLGAAHLLASKDRIGAILSPGAKKWVWIELDFTGNLRGQWEIDAMKWTPGAFTAGGALYANRMNGRTVVGTAVFDRPGNSWTKVHGVPAASVLVADGEELICRMKTDPPLNFLCWFLPRL